MEITTYKPKVSFKMKFEIYIPPVVPKEKFNKDSLVIGNKYKVINGTITTVTLAGPAGNDVQDSIMELIEIEDSMPIITTSGAQFPGLWGDIDNPRYVFKEIKSPNRIHGHSLESYGILWHLRYILS